MLLFSNYIFISHNLQHLLPIVNYIILFRFKIVVTAPVYYFNQKDLDMHFYLL
jgi:hypothetical protein